MVVSAENINDKNKMLINIDTYFNTNPIDFTSLEKVFVVLWMYQI